jgi:hypothetical protein
MIEDHHQKPRVFSLPATTWRALLLIWIGLAFPVGGLILHHTFSAIDENARVAVRDRETQASRFMEEMHSHVTVEKSLRTFLAEHWHLIKDGFHHSKGFRLAKSWLPRSTVLYYDTATNEFLTDRGDRPVPLYPYRQLAHMIAQVACRKQHLTPAEIMISERLFGKDFHLVYSSDNQMYPIELTFDRENTTDLGLVEVKGKSQTTRLLEILAVKDAGLGQD